MPISLKSTGGGSITLAAPATASDYTLTFPAQNGTPITTLPSTAGNVLTSDGTNWVSQALSVPAGVPTGMIVDGPYFSATTASASGTGSVATITFTPAYTIPVGSTVTISGVTPSGYNGVYTVTASSSGSVSFASSTTGSQTVAGSVVMSPEGFLLCDGSVYNRSAYPNLSGLIGTPILATSATNSYTNASLVSPNVFGSANNVLFMNGTAANIATSAATANTIFTSTDGITWTGRTAWTIANPSSANEDIVAHNGSVYAAIGYLNGGSPGDQNWILYSSDLVTWSKSSFGPGGYTYAPYMIAAGGSGGYFVTQGPGLTVSCVGQQSAILISNNASSWSALTPPAGFPANGTNGLGLVSAAGNTSGLMIITSGSNGQKVIFSATGAGTYSDVTSGISGTPTFASCANNLFIITTSTGAVYTSTNPSSVAWTLRNSSGRNQKYLWNGTAYVTKDGYYTADFINYGSTTATTTYGARGIANGNKLYNKSGTSVFWWDFNSYTSATQFPVPTITTSVTNNTTLLDSPFNYNRYYIKT